jgi:predicted DNA-binding ribbon-helix-helix protein
MSEASAPVSKRSTVVRRAVRISGRPTGVSLENTFWEAFREIALVMGTTRPTLLAKIEKQHAGVNPSSAVRLFVLAHYRPIDRMSLKTTDEKRRVASLVSKRSLKIAGHSTSVSLEEAFWSALKEIAAAKQTPISDLVALATRDM